MYRRVKKREGRGKERTGGKEKGESEDKKEKGGREKAERLNIFLKNCTVA